MHTEEDRPKYDLDAILEGQLEKPEQPTASANIKIGIIKLAGHIELPGKEAPNLIKLLGSLGSLVVMGVVCPAITARAGASRLLPGQAAA